ncbi:TolC family protein [Pseudoduganella armeniaca]|uniref:Protein CyaE n=1 Tax=Pseudoduganella armeniaca TaxID=2072590 RepID=A0A2R4C9U8_9BURK|nr:TolC family protein [Pseudoduganella armeniaca]AVR96371.1 hypothetical protein C9I28_12150 [Pseudoduganella armeniaca]
MMRWGSLRGTTTRHVVAACFLLPIGLATTCAFAQATPADFDPRSPLGCDLPSSREALNLRDALRIGLCVNPELKRAYARQREQAAEIDVAKGAYYPTLRLTQSHSKVSKTTDYNDVFGTQFKLRGPSSDTNLVLSWVLYDFGLRAANLEGARSLLLASLAEQDQAYRDAVVEIVRAFMKARYATTVAQVAAQSVDSAARSVDITQGLATGGANSRIDLLLAKNALGQAQLRKIRSDSERNATIAELNSRLGLALTTPQTLVGDDFSALATLEFADATRIIEAAQRDPRVQAASHMLTAARAREAAARADGKPVVTFYSSAYKSLSPPSQATTDVRIRGNEYGIRFEWPLFDGYARSSRARATMAQVQAAEAELGLTLRDTQAMLWKLYEEVDAGRKKLKLAQEMVTNAETAFGLAEGRYRSGIGSLLELLRAQQDLDNQRLESLQAANDAHTASFTLAIALGIFH